MRGSSPRMTGVRGIAPVTRLLLAHPRHSAYITPREAAPRVRSHISPGPYRSFRELSLARSVDLGIWCPPTFVGNSGIERSNGGRGFALCFLLFVMPRECGVSSKLRLRGSILKALEYWVARFRGR